MIITNGLSKKFGDFYALNSVSCKIPEGSVCGMVGSNGAGKSTFLRMLAGVYKADGGDIIIDGQKVYENPEIKQKICFVPDELYFLSGASLDRMAKLYSSVYKNFDRIRYNELTEMFKLSTDKNIGTFSKGMKRQAATLLALSSKAEYIFFDETFDGLDPIMRNFVKQIICEDILDRGATAIITSHSLRELEDTCDQMSLLHKGGLVFEKDVHSLKTSLFKVQIAFKEDYSKEKFIDLDIYKFTKTGSVAEMIVKGDKNITENALRKMNPVILDVLPLTLEEVFTFELSERGYVFDFEEANEDER